jgi:hypothetical protein
LQASPKSLIGHSQKFSMLKFWQSKFFSTTCFVAKVWVTSLYLAKILATFFNLLSSNAEIDGENVE